MSGNRLASGKRAPGREGIPAAWFGKSPEAVLVTDRAGLIEYVNPAFEALTGYARAEVIRRTPALLKSGAHQPDFYRRLWRAIRQGKAFREVFINRKKSGELYRVENLIWPAFDRRGGVAHFVCAGRDVTERIEETEKLAHAATHDPLTDLPNRTLFLDRLGHALRHAEREGEGLAVAIMDIDRFRRTNARHGHLAGDAVLRAVASRTARCLRDADTVARMGGDEFALLLPGIERRPSVVSVLDKVLRANSVPVRFEDKRIGVALSIGASLYPRDSTDATALLKRADRAMYAAKRRGGNRCQFSSSRPARRGSAAPHHAPASQHIT